METIVKQSTLAIYMEAVEYIHTFEIGVAPRISSLSCAIDFDVDDVRPNERPEGKQ